MLGAFPKLLPLTGVVHQQQAFLVKPTKQRLQKRKVELVRGESLLERAFDLLERRASVQHLQQSKLLRLQPEVTQRQRILEHVHIALLPRLP